MNTPAPYPDLAARVAALEGTVRSVAEMLGQIADMCTAAVDSSAPVLADVLIPAVARKEEARADDPSNDTVASTIAAMNRAHEIRRRVDGINRRRASIERALRAMPPGSRLVPPPIPADVIAALAARHNALLALRGHRPSPLPQPLSR